MPSRNELAVRARNVGLDPNTYTNDSKLEQKVLWLEKNHSTFAGSLATGTLTDATTQPSNNDTVTIGGVTYTWKTALTEATASTTLTSNGTTPTDGDAISVEGQTYVFRTTLTNGGTAPYEVFINGSAANALANLKKAINASGVAGTDYGTGTLAHPLVSGGTLTGTTLVVSAKRPGVYGNNFATVVVTGSTLSFTGTTLAGGADPVANQVLIGASVSASMTNLAAAINGTGVGTTTSTGTAAHPQVSATSTATTVALTAKDYNVTNANVATTVSSTGAVQSFGAATLTGGVDKTVAQDTTTVNGGLGLSGDKDV